MAKKTKNGLEILERIINVSPRVRRGIERERQRADIAQEIHDARVDAGLSQEQLARLMGTSQSAIARLEDADYQGHSLRMLERIARALHCTVHVALKRRQRAASVR